MSIFNSLGSNYSGSFALKSLLNASFGKKDSIKLAKSLSGYYGGKSTILTYKGREAMELALRKSGLPAGSFVGLNGFTCYVLYRAIENAGYKPVLIDVADRQMHFGADELELTYAKQPLQAIIVQNTLGYPADILGIEPFCRQANIMIIEDLAHSNGAIYEGGREAGRVAPLVMLSFSQDKPIDVVAGGAMIDRREASSTNIDKLPKVSLIYRLRVRAYPFWTTIIRGSYASGLGRGLHFVLKRLKLLSTPMDDKLSGLHTMTPATSKLLLGRLSQSAPILAHRREIAKIYKSNLPVDCQFIQKEFGDPAYLRFPVWVENRQALVDFLKTEHIFVGDTWYDAPIAPKRYLSKANYISGACPRAELLAAHIVNLPTHSNLSSKQALMIAEKVAQWLKSSPKH